MVHKIKLHKGSSINLKFKEDPVEIEKNGEKVPPNTPHCEVVDSLLWLANWSRPDISYAVSTVAKYYCDPRVAHWKACKRISSYLAGTQDYCIHYTPQSVRSSLQNVGLPAGYFISKRPSDVDTDLVSYVDANLANSIVW